MSETTWYRSLYWRIALGFVLFLAGVLVVQGAVLSWLINRSESAPGPPPRGFVRLVALDLGSAMAANPSLNIQAYLDETYEQRGYPFFVLMSDGRVFFNGGQRPSPLLIEDATERLSRFLRPRSVVGTLGRRDGGGGDRPALGEAPGPGEPSGSDALEAVPSLEGDAGPIQLELPTGGGQQPRRGGGRFGSFAGEIVVDARIRGMVSAMPQTVVGQFGPTMAVVGLGLVAGATALAALMIVGPVRTRLRDLEAAAGRVGAGDLTARAREDGGDEVSRLARAFNGMAADLKARAEQVESADRARRLLLADVSHELRTPLTAMRGYLETLSMSELTLDQETRRRYVNIVSDESRRLERIIGDLLDLARLEGRGDTLQREDVPIEDLFGRVVSRHEREAQVRKVTLTTSIAPDAEIVYGDPLRLEQVLQNLAANALRHTPSGGTVDLRAEIDGDDILLSVRDSGHGIPAEHLPFIFERFYKVDPARTHDTPGCGLGLSIVKAIVERHGGIVTVSSSEKGTIFTIRIPAAGTAEPSAA